MADDVVRLEGVLRLRRNGAGAFAVRIEKLDLAAGGAYAAAGPSGCGKSTLLDILALALRPDRAERFVLEPAGGREAIDIAAAWADGSDAILGRIRRRHIGYVLQTGGLLPFVTVADNIALPARLNARSDRARLIALAERLGIVDQLAKYPADLSVGQRQRAAIARALIHRPSIVLADEPTAALDPEAAEIVMTLLVEQTRRDGATLVVATHDHIRAQRHALVPISFAPVRIGGAPGSSVALAPHGQSAEAAGAVP
ncbi:MAG: ATP-binding cassette domain-containing protein [Alphaproteobacteria bacterium]|nr:ATP-binding cassette domain-containing protein [Alphaproteobacteria bacterium]